MRFHQDNDPETGELHKRYRTIALYTFAVLVAVALFTLLLFNFKNVTSFLYTLISSFAVIFYGVFIACALFPFFLLFRRLFALIFKKSPRLCEVLSLVFTYVFLIALLAIILLAVIPSFGDEIAHFIDALKAAVDHANSLLAAKPSLAFLKDIFTDFSNRLLDRIVTPDKLLSYASDVLSGAYNIAIGTIISVYLLASRKKLGALGGKVMLAVLPKSFFERMMLLFRSFYRGFIEFFFARLLLSIALSGLSYFFCWIIGIPFRGIIMLILLIAGLIPFLGPIIGVLVCTVLVLLISPSNALYLFAFILFIHVLEGHFLKKKLLRPKLRPGAAVTSICVLIGYTLLGFAGAIMAVPVYAAVTLNLREFQVRHLLHRGYRVEDHHLVHQSEEDAQYTFIDEEPEEQKK